jgi:hypothetical protein
MYNTRTNKANNTDKLCQKGCNGNIKTNQQHNLIIDILIGIGFLIAFAPDKTGLAIYEWLSLGLLGGLITHVLLRMEGEIVPQFA